MRHSPKLLACVTLAAISSVSAGIPTTQNDLDLVETAAAAGNFETLIAAVRAAGLVELLRSDGPFTVLAPTDGAFAALPEGTLDALLRPESRDRLVAILERHVVAGRVNAADALAAGFAQTMAGDRLTVAVVGGRLTIDGANVVGNDVVATNGLIHAIDRMLLPPAAAATPSPSASNLIELAIDRGVPLFNGGQVAACAAIYEVAAFGLLACAEAPLPEPARAGLATALRSGGSARERAWQLRQALDAAHLALQRGTPQSLSGGETLTIEDFDVASSGAAWRIVNDTVMGGVSKSEMVTGGDGTAVFAGEVSLENNGGFASTWRVVDAGTLEGYAGVLLRVRGDGKAYRFGVNPRTQVSGDLYQAEFATEDGEWIEVRMPFAELERSIMGFRPPEAKPIDPARIRQVGFTIAGKEQDGPFRLEIDWIRAY